MKYKLNRLGGTFELEGTLKEIIPMASLIKSIPEVCPLCQGGINFHYRKPKGFEYYSLKCNKCHATKNFSVAQADNALYLDYKKEFEVFNKEASPVVDAGPDSQSETDSIPNAGLRTPF